jgi:aminoglycoside 6'-N-acetyltransferase
MDSTTLKLETPRLILRPFQDSDLEAFVAYRSDPEVARYQGWEAPYSLEEGVRFIQKMKSAQPATPGEWYKMAIERKADGQMIGDCAFQLLASDARQAEIGLTLARPYQGCGYGTEAVQRLLDYLFGELGLHRVRANTDVENIASVRALEHIGLRREGHFIENLWFKSRWSSEYWYAMLEREWAENHRHEK